MKVLLVEDHELNAQMIARRLRARGLEVTIVGDGEEAVTAATALLPDVILMDIGLPKLDGIEATRRIKHAPTTARIPIIVLTAHVMSNECEDAIAAGADVVEEKPIDFERLMQRIQAVVRT